MNKYAVANWLWFCAGYVINVITQAQASASSESNGLKGMDDWLILKWPIIAVRFFVAILLAPVLFTFVPASVQTAMAPYTLWGGLGYVADSLLDKALFIFGGKLGTKIEVPLLRPPAVKP